VICPGDRHAFVGSTFRIDGRGDEEVERALRQHFANSRWARRNGG